MSFVDQSMLFTRLNLKSSARKKQLMKPDLFIQEAYNILVLNP